VPLLRHALPAGRVGTQGRSLIEPPIRTATPGAPSSRTLIVAPSWVGDAIISQPLLARLRAADPAEPIDVLAPRWCGAVYRRMPEVAEVVDSPFGHGELGLRSRWRLAGSLRGRGYRRAYVLPNSLKSALVPWLAGIPHRIGFVGEQRRLLLTDARRLDRASMPRLVDRFSSLAPAAPAPTRAPPSVPSLVVDPSARAAVAARLRLDTSRPVLALCPGAEYGPAKRWPAPYFAEVARRALAAGQSVWILGSRNDAAAAAEIASLAPGAIDLTGATSLGDAIDLLSFASRVVTNDSGLMHVAAALDRPMVAIFGSSSPDYTPPLSGRATVARLDIACSPCFERTCPLGHTDCLRKLGVERVLALVDALPASE
jgi:heptosyltransferase-2